MGIANDHIDALSLSSGMTASSGHQRELEYLKSERRFLSNRGLDGAQVDGQKIRVVLADVEEKATAEGQRNGAARLVI